LNEDGESDDVFPLTKLQYRAMSMWASGTFDRDGPPEPPEQLPDSLTRIALESCAGGPFFPGIEAGRIMRDPARYMEGDPFRLSHAALKPGEVTQGNAVPWQADFHLCRWEEFDGASRKRLGWWPAQRPDDVLKTADAATSVSWTRGLADVFASMIANWHRLGFVKRDSIVPNAFVEQDRDPTLMENGNI
jgi:hypothetical protein